MSKSLAPLCDFYGKKKGFNQFLKKNQGQPLCGRLVLHHPSHRHPVLMNSDIRRGKASVTSS